MPCSDSSSGINVFLDSAGRLLKFQFAKITCSQEISSSTGYAEYCQGQSPETILEHRYADLVNLLKLHDEEKQFILHLEWEALRAAIAQYLGLTHPDIDSERCKITSISYSPEGVEINEVILPPKSLPKIMACGMIDGETSH